MSVLHTVNLVQKQTCLILFLLRLKFHYRRWCAVLANLRFSITDNFTHESCVEVHKILDLSHCIHS